jgi:hypothetical protein
MFAEAYDIRPEEDSREVAAIRAMLIEGFESIEEYLPLSLVQENGDNPGESVLIQRPLLPVALVTANKGSFPVDSSGNRIVAPGTVVQAIATKFDLTEYELIDHDRRIAITPARQLAIYLVRNLSNMSYPAIGVFFDGRDHTTIIHAVQKVTAAIEDPKRLKFAREVAKIREEILNADLSVDDNEGNYKPGFGINKLLILHEGGLVACPWVEMANEPDILMSSSKIALDWKLAEESADIYRKYGNVTKKLILSVRQNNEVVSNNLTDLV